jgi:hypothetical protein
LLELGEVDQAAELGEVEDVLERSALERRCEVDDGAQWGGDRDPAVERDIVWPERAAAVQADAAPPRSSPAAGHRHVDRARSARAQVPGGRGLRWLSAPPVASVAAFQRPSIRRPVWPTA